MVKNPGTGKPRNNMRPHPARLRFEPGGNENAPKKIRDRVLHVLDLMVRDEWARGHTSHLIAHEWGLGVDCIEGYAAEASRLREILLHDREKIKELNMLRLHKIADTGVDKDAVAAIRTQLQAMGEFSTTKVDIAVSAAPTPQVVAVAIRQALQDPEMRKMILEEINRYGEEKSLTSNALALLTEGTEVKE